MKQVKYIFLLLMVAFMPSQLCAQEAEGEKLNIPEVVLEHLGDSYEWHIRLEKAGFRTSYYG